MKCIKKAISFLLLGSMIFSAASCGLVYIPNTEEKAFEELLPKLFEALDNGDEAALYHLFSPVIREECDNLQEQITALISVYSGPTDEFDITPIHSTEHIGNPGNWSSADTVIPVRSGDNYYFFNIALMYEHYDENQIGITLLEFYTADERCAWLESDDKQSEYKGLYLYAEKNLECDIRTIDGRPRRYTPTNQTINVEEVRDFLKSSCSFSGFVERFGEANAKSPIVEYYYYELPKEKGEPRYLLVCEHDGEIYGVTIVDDFKFVELVWENE